MKLKESLFEQKIFTKSTINVENRTSILNLNEKDIPLIVLKNLVKPLKIMKIITNLEFNPLIFPFFSNTIHKVLKF